VDAGCGLNNASLCCYFVSLPVCVLIKYKNDIAKHEFIVHVVCVRGSDVLQWHCDTYCIPVLSITSCFHILAISHAMSIPEQR